MEEQGAVPNSVHRHGFEYANSKPEPELDNRLVLIRALAYLPFAVNLVAPKEPPTESPENVLGENVFRVGLVGTVRHGGPKWP